MIACNGEAIAGAISPLARLKKHQLAPVVLKLLYLYILHYLKDALALPVEYPLL